MYPICNTHSLSLLSLFSLLFTIKSNQLHQFPDLLWVRTRITEDGVTLEGLGLGLGLGLVDGMDPVYSW